MSTKVLSDRLLVGSSVAARVDGSLKQINIANLTKRTADGKITDIDGNELMAKAFKYVKVDDDYTAADRDYVEVLTKSKAITVKLPASPSEGQSVFVKDAEDNALNNNITIDGNGEKIGGDDSLLIDISGIGVELFYLGDKWSFTL